MEAARGLNGSAHSSAAVTEVRPVAGAVTAIRRAACIICCAPRTGSSVLAEALAATGYTGRPEEYFDVHQKNRDHWTRTLGIAGPADYLDKVIAAGSTANGVFGLKLHWHQVPALLDAFADSKGLDRKRATRWPLDEWLTSRFATSYYLWLRRRNKVAQGISYYRAVHSDIWRVRPGVAAKPASEGPEVQFNFAEVDRHVRLGEEFDRDWLAFFKSRKLKVLVLVYEDFIAEYEKTLRGVWQYLGMGAQPLTIPPMRLERQADALSLEWEREYRRLKQEEAASKPRARMATIRAPRRAQASSGAQSRPRVAAAPVQTHRPAPVPAAAPVPASAPVEQEIEPHTIIAYDLGSNASLRLVAAPQRRGWMDATPNRFAYRCLPLVIANQAGWLLLCPTRLSAIWNGDPSLEALTVQYEEGETQRVATSHFGSGILTFTMNFIFRTPRGVNLYVRGPANLPKDGIYPLEGIIETDWSEATFTMNWKMMRPHVPVIFEKNEPFAMVSPIARGELERYRPEIRPIADNPSLDAGFRAFAASRASFNLALKVKDSPEQKMGWQRDYIRGQTVTAKKAREHQTTLKLPEFLDKRER
jgi:LPS sulfotransferase NodH